MQDRKVNDSVTFVSTFPCSRRITSGPLTASITWDTGSPFSSKVVMARRYFRMCMKNFWLH